MNEKWIIFAKDSNSPYFRNKIWVDAMHLWKDYGIDDTFIGISSKENDIDYLIVQSSWLKAGETFFAKIKDNLNLFEDIIDQAKVNGEKMNAFTEKLFHMDLSKKKTEELIVLYKEFTEFQAREYALGVLLPLVDLGGSSLVEGKLKEFLKEKVSDENYLEYHQVFTFPSNDSFQEEQEFDLLELYGSLSDNEKNVLLKDNALDVFKKDFIDVYEKIVLHTAKYCWVYYVYAGPAYTEKDFIGFLQDYLKKGINAQDEIDKKKERRKIMEEKKAKYVLELKPDVMTQKIIDLSGKLVWAKPRRKDLQSKSYYHIEKLQIELGKRFSLSLSEVRACPLSMMESGEIDKEIIKEIIRVHVLVPENGETQFLYGKDAEQFISTEIKAVEEKEVSESNEIKGTCACPGEIIEGKAKIVNKPVDMAKMEYGDILISVATTPSIVPAMKKASAIVTDEGGLTCHAAIVSREMDIPCVVSTHHATKVIKDGELIKVDSVKGILTKVKEF
tara:strand:+ start:490 stop:1995 length:1506 start_codon:yes stop_codon:yes gene_type:complete